MTAPPLLPQVPRQREETAPTPPRFWWLKRGAAAVAAVGLLLLAVRLGWGLAAQGRLDAELAAARVRGEPTTLQDFDDPTPTPGDDANAADLIKRAIGQLTSTQAEQQWDGGWFPDAPLTMADRAMLRSIVAENAGPLALARRAADQPTANWGVRLRPPLSAAFGSGSLNQRRDLANVLLKSFTLSHDAGDDATAMVDLRAIVRESDAMSSDLPFIITRLVAFGIEGMGTETLERTAGTLKIDGRARPVADALLRQLCDASADRIGNRRQWYGEQLFQIEVAYNPTAITGGSPAASAMIWPLRPMLTMGAARSVRALAAVADATGQPTWPAARAGLPAQPTGGGESALSTLESMVRQIWGASFDRPIETEFRALTDRRLAAVVLALRLYQADHAGHLPTALSALVPAYLPAVPIDPMSPDGHALRYLATRGQEAVYSVGTDGIDDGGSTVSTRPPTAGNHISRWDRKDVVCPLVPPPAATQPGD